MGVPFEARDDASYNTREMRSYFDVGGDKVSIQHQSEDVRRGRGQQAKSLGTVKGVASGRGRDGGAGDGVEGDGPAGCVAGG
jgi:hypothetical protein